MRIKALLVLLQLCLLVCVDATAQYHVGHSDNVVCVAPLVIRNGSYGSGLSYERYFLRGKWLSVHVPVDVVVNTRATSSGYMLLFTPGVKVYPALTSFRPWNFAIGPNLVMGVGKGDYFRNNTDYVNYYAFTYNTSTSHFLYGFMVNASANTFVTRHFYLGAEAGLGIATVNRYAGVNMGRRLLTGLSLKMGYAFNTVHRQPRQLEEPMRE